MKKSVVCVAVHAYKFYVCSFAYSDRHNEQRVAVAGATSPYGYMQIELARELSLMMLAQCRIM
jgi:hypothetical protein